MPFDNTPDVALDNRHRLIEALRQPLPFKWDFTRQRSCAIGLAQHMGMVKVGSTIEMAKALGISCEKSYSIFVLGRVPMPWYSRRKFKMSHYRKVTPKRIAKAIENL